MSDNRIPSPLPQRPTAPPEVKASALRWTTVQHVAAIAAITTLAIVGSISGEVALGGILATIGVVNLPAMMGRGPAGTASAFGLLAFGAKLLMHLKDGGHV